jgi:hypothetical protein
LLVGSSVPYPSQHPLKLAGVQFGLGKNLWDLNLLTILENVKHVVQILLICQCLQATALAFVKLSIISTYWRIFPSQWVKHTLFVLAALVTSVAIVTIFGTIFQCRPIAAAWDFTIQNGSCIQVRTLFLFATVFSVLTDVLLCVIPMPLIWRLKISMQDKIGISGLFGLGLVAAAASLVRLTRLINGVGQINVTMDPMQALGWSVAEVITGVVCACIPTYKPLARKLLPTSFFSYVRSRATLPSHNTARRSRNRASTASEVYVIQHMGPSEESGTTGRPHPGDRQRWYPLKDLKN